MRALTYQGNDDIRCETVPDAVIEGSRDTIVKATACAVWGTNLPVFNNVVR